MKRHRKTAVRFALIGGSSWLAASGAPVAAQTSVAPPPAEAAEPESGIADIVVTAAKRSERAQDVPIAITALSGGDLAARGVNDAVALTRTVPGLNASVTSGYGGKLTYTLRGVGLNTYSEVQESAVALYQDEVYIASPIGAQFSLFDVDRVEVLRGPQGTLFGRSASGGLISYVSRSPGLEANGSVTLGLGSYGERIVEAAQDVPLDASGDNALRASFRYYGSDGFIRNESGGKNLEGGDMYSGRAQLRLKPASNVTLLFKGEHSEFDSDHTVAYKHLASYVDADGVSRLIGPDENIYGTPGGDLFAYRASDEYYSTDSNDPSIQRIQRTLLNNRVDWDLGGVTLTSITGYIRIREFYEEDTDGAPMSFITYGIRNRTRQFQQELRLSSGAATGLRWTAGAFYFSYDIHYDTVVRFPEGIAPLGIDTPFDARSIADQQRHSFAGYGQVDLPLTASLSLTAGGRIERESADFTYRQVFTPVDLVSAVLGVGPVDFSPATEGDLARIRKTYYSGGVTLNYKPERGVLLYASLKRGIKPDGFSTPIAGIPADQMRFDEEKLDALEGGVKSDWLNGRLRLNAAAYNYWYNDYQAVQFKGTQTYTGNAKARLSGLDAEIVWAPSRIVEFGASGGYVDAVARDIPLVGSNGVAIRDRRMPNAPKVSLNAYARITTDLAGGTLSLRADEVFRSRTFFEIQNNPALVQDAYHTEDVSVSWTDDDWSLSATLSNVLGAKYLAYVQDNSSFGFVDATPAKPRWISVQLTRRW